MVKSRFTRNIRKAVTITIPPLTIIQYAVTIIIASYIFPTSYIELLSFCTAKA
ncbi:MAG: hypothetical protein ACPLVF_07540 [Thermovenabulum sp.]